MQRLIDAWFELGREIRPQRYSARTRDGWRLALYRFPLRRSAHRTPVLLCHGMSSNRWDMDGPGRISMARYLQRRGYDVWVVELRGAGRSTRPTWWNGKSLQLDLRGLRAARRAGGAANRAARDRRARRCTGWDTRWAA